MVVREQSAGVRRLHVGAGVQKLRRECLESWRGIGGVDDAIVVAGDGKDGRGIVAIGLVKLVVVLGSLSKVVDDVAEVEEERGYVCGVDFGEVGDHLVGDQGLRARPRDAPGIADGVEDDLSGLLDGLRTLAARLGTINLSKGEDWFHRSTLGLGYGFEVVEPLIFLVCDGVLKPAGIGRRRWLAKDGLTAGGCRRVRCWLWGRLGLRLGNRTLL